MGSQTEEEESLTSQEEEEEEEEGVVVEGEGEEATGLEAVKHHSPNDSPPAASVHRLQL